MKKILCLLLAVLMIVPVFAACNNEEKPPVTTGDGTDNSGDTTNSDDSSSNTSNTHKVPTSELDFQNEEFYSIAFEWQGYKHYFFAEEESSDPMDAALYNRRRSIEDALNCTMTHYLYPKYSEMNKVIDQEVSVGDTPIDLAHLHCIRGTTEFSSSGYLYPLDDLPYIDVTAPWWNVEQMENLRLGSKYYFGVNDYMIPCPYVIFFNKEMVEDMADMQNPYDLVLNQKWTLDVFEEMARAATSYEGVPDADKGSYGVAVDDDSTYCSFLIAADQPVAAKNSDGRLEVVLNTEKAADIYDRFDTLANDGILFPTPSQEPDQITMESGRLLFLLAPITAAENLRDCDVEFGMVPYPKYNEEQEDYKTLDWGGLMCVPSAVANPELCGAVIELLAYESKKEVIPTYYDIVLDGQLSRDPDTVKMLDILFDTICYEPAMNYWGLSAPMQYLFFCLSDGAISSENGFASWYAQHESASQKQINDYYDTLALIEALYN